MPYTMTYTSGLQVGSSSENKITGILQTTVDGVIANKPTETIPAAVSGVLTTRTSDTAGIITVASHNITTDDKVCVFWTAGVAYYATVDEISGTSVTISAASGDVLPAEDSVVTISLPIEIDAIVDGDAIKGISVQADQRIISLFMDSVPSVITTKETTASQSWVWADNTGVDSEFVAESLTSVLMYNGSTTAATGAVLIGYDNIV